MSNHTLLDLAWERINELGGTVSHRDDHGLGFNEAIGQCLDILDELKRESVKPIPPESFV